MTVDVFTGNSWISLCDTEKTKSASMKAYRDGIKRSLHLTKFTEDSEKVLGCDEILMRNCVKSISCQSDLYLAYSHVLNMLLKGH